MHRDILTQAQVSTAIKNLKWDEVDLSIPDYNLLTNDILNEFKRLVYEACEYYPINFFGLHYDKESNVYVPMFSLSEGEVTQDLIKYLYDEIQLLSHYKDVIDLGHIVYIDSRMATWWLYNKQPLVCIGHHRRVIGKSLLGLYVYDDHIFLNLLPTCK